MTDVNDIVAAKIEAARRRIAADKERRERQAAARNAGLAQRHAAKLRHLRGSEDHADDLNGAEPTSLAERGPKGRRPDPPEEPMPVLVAHCPSCRAERITKRVASAHVRGRPVVLVECTSTDCELIWAIRPGRNHTPTAAPAAA